MNRCGSQIEVAEVGLVDLEAAEVEVDLHLRAISGTDFVTAAAEAAAAVFDLKTRAGLDVALSVVEDLSVWAYILKLTTIRGSVS